MAFYHYQEFYPALQNTKSYYIMMMDNGVRFRIIAGFVSGIQVTTRYNSTPASGTGDTDNLYLLTLGYQLRHDQETVVPTEANAVHPNPREEKLC